LRILDIHGSESNEVVVSIPRLLREFLFESEQGNSGKFRILYCNEGIIACLYTSTAPDSVAYLIALDIHKGEILLTYELPCTEKIFVRHNSKFLYYGTYFEENHYGHKKWTLRGYRFQEREWFDQRIFLGYLNGCEIGATICFEIFNGYFYALSNQTNYDVEEVDWTSFYHCVRFPVASPSKSSLEKTALDESMWRRQHREGPIDDRWGNLALRRDEATGELKIVETRREFLLGAGRSQRTYYSTTLVFPERHRDRVSDLSSSDGPATNSNIDLLSSTITTLDESSSRIGLLEKHTLAALTNDRLALTLKPNDNPHWLRPQPRFPRNVHTGNDGCFIFSQTHLRYYNSSAKTFMDLVDDPPLDNPTRQRLRLRVGSRKLDPPSIDSDGILVREATDPMTGEILYGLNDRYTARPVTFWPPDRGSCALEDHQLADIYTLMNPPTHMGNIEVTSDERSFIYATGGKHQPRALILINFDPGIKLRGLPKWPQSESRCESGEFRGSVSGGMNSPPHDSLQDKSKEEGKGKEKAKDGGSQPREQPRTADEIPFIEVGRNDIDNADNTERWIWREVAMYTAIKRGFDLTL
jgi:hypothetical protein